MKKYLLLFALLLCAGPAFSAGNQFKTTPLDKDVKEYITQKYKPVSGKKTVIYATEKPNCPYGQAFMQSVDKQRKRTDLQKDYAFYGRVLERKASSEKEMTQFIKFFNSCGLLCVVSIKNNWIYSIGNSVGIEEAEMLPKMFDSLKSKK